MRVHFSHISEAVFEYGQALRILPAFIVLIVFSNEVLEELMGIVYLYLSRWRMGMLVLREQHDKTYNRQEDYS